MVKVIYMSSRDRRDTIPSVDVLDKPEHYSVLGYAAKRSVQDETQKRLAVTD